MKITNELAEAYLRLAKVYEKMMKPNKALKVLEKGFKETSDARVKKYLDKLLEAKTSFKKLPATVTICGAEYDTASAKMFVADRTFLSAQDIDAIGKLVNLTHLNILLTPVCDTAPLANLTALEELYLNSDNISDINFVKGLTRLKEFRAGGNRISDITALAHLTNLNELLLERNLISDLSPLSELANLKELCLYSNQISDITPLADLTNLKELDLRDNQISEEDKTWLKQQLPNCSISF